MSALRSAMPVACALCAWPVLALADEIEIDFAPLNTCLTAATNLAQARACVGTGAETCIAAQGGSSTMTDPLCFYAETQWWEARLDLLNTRLLQSAAELDQMYADMSVSSQAVADLNDLQVAWTQYKQTACAYHIAEFALGSGEAPQAALCDLRRTAMHTLDLEWELAID